MQRFVAATLFVLGMAQAALGQEQAPASLDANRNVAADFAETSAARAPVPRPKPSGQPRQEVWAAAPADGDFRGLSFSTAPAAPASFLDSAAATSSTLVPPAPRAVASPAATEAMGLGDVDYRMQLSVSFALVRFRSSAYSATGVGWSTSFAYFFSQRLAVEANVIDAFAPTIFANEHVKYLGYGVGPKVVLWNARFAPWAHAIVGGVHIVPQTALGGRNGFALQLGGGVDYELIPRVAARIEADYVRTQLFGQSQNNGQATLGLVLHF
jgi:hypothetical protein